MFQSEEIGKSQRRDGVFKRRGRHVRRNHVSQIERERERMKQKEREKERMKPKEREVEREKEIKRGRDRHEGGVRE